MDWLKSGFNAVSNFASEHNPFHQDEETIGPQQGIEKAKAMAAMGAEKLGLGGVGDKLTERGGGDIKDAIMDKKDAILAKEHALEDKGMHMKDTVFEKASGVKDSALHKGMEIKDKVMGNDFVQKGMGMAKGAAGSVLSAGKSAASKVGSFLGF